jgi:hypothetical protein
VSIGAAPALSQAEDGLVIPIIAINKHIGLSETPPEIVSRGFVSFEEDRSGLLQEARQVVSRTLETSTAEAGRLGRHEGEGARRPEAVPEQADVEAPADYARDFGSLTGRCPHCHGRFHKSDIPALRQSSCGHRSQAH